jgi:aryl-alcohol dehydrogenase-like predicted oxidoreductase
MLSDCGIAVADTSADRRPSAGDWHRLTRRIADSIVLSAVTAFALAVGTAGLLHVLNGPSRGATSSWAQVLTVGAFYGVATVAFASIDRGSGAGPGPAATQGRRPGRICGRSRSGGGSFRRVIAQQPFGRTGHRSSRVIFGAAALGSMRQERADELLGLLLEHGVNHIDTAASYGDSELRVGPWMAEHRDRFFLATKTGERTGDAARAELERSLERLQVDSVDLIQLHNLVEPDDWETAHAPGGAVEAMAKARDEGLVRFIGVTGHGDRIARMHLRSLERFPFDSVLLPYSFVGLLSDGYRADVDELLAVCVERQVAVQTIKAVARRRWPDDHTGPQFSWYEPLADPAAIARAVQWALSNPQVFLNTSSDARLLPAILAAATGPFEAPTDDEMRHDVDTEGARSLFEGGVERI